MALIEYVGKQTNRVDDVLKSPRVWAKAGDVVEVPDSDKNHYLLHPGEWQEITPEEHQAKNSARLDLEARLNSMARIWEVLTIPEIKTLIDRMKAEVALREKRGDEGVAAKMQDIHAKEKTKAAMKAVAGETPKPVAQDSGIKLRMRMMIDDLPDMDRDEMLELAEEFDVKARSDIGADALRSRLAEYFTENS